MQRHVGVHPAASVIEGETARAVIEVSDGEAAAAAVAVVRARWAWDESTMFTIR